MKEQSFGLMMLRSKSSRFFSVLFDDILQIFISINANQDIVDTVVVHEFQRMVDLMLADPFNNQKGKVCEKF